MKRDAFLFYRSFAESAQMVQGEADRLQLYEALIHYGLEEEIPELKYPLNAILNQIIASIKSAQEKHDKSVADGAKGGRPRKWVDQAEAEEAYQRLGSWDAVADELAVDPKTLRKARAAWAERGKAKREKRKNLNVNGNENANGNGNSHSIQETVSTVAPEGAPSPRPGDPGYVFRKRDGWYKVDEEGLVVKISDE